MTAIVLGFFGLLTGIAWPLVLLTISIAYKPEILLFLPNLFALFLRSRKVKIAGVMEVEIDAAEQQQKAADLIKIDADSSTVKLKEIPGLVRTAAIARLERDLHTRLKDITPDTDPVDVLVRNLAQARLEAAFGFIYAGIFGSQIARLIALEARRRVPTDEAHKFYLEIETKYPEVYAGYGFAGWIGFLKHHGLVTQVGDDITITDFGDDFLEWLRATRLSVNKPW